MNKIYRVVWNETTQTWNAVAEFAKAHGKTASSGIGGIVASAGVRFAFTAIMSGLLLASGQAVATVENNGKTLANGTVLSAAADGTDYNTCYFDTVSYNVVCGDDTTKALDFIPQTGGQPPKQGKSVAIGQGAQTSGESNVAIGPKTVTANTGSIAIGVAASANHNQSIAMGQEASAKGEADVSIGKLAGDTVSSDGRNISIGESALKGGSGVNNVIAIGSSAGINSNSSHSVYIGTGATGMDPKNISIGYQANTKSGSIAVGDNSNAQGSSSVAIGTKSVVTDVAGNGVAIGFNSTTSGLSAVAIGGSSSIGKGANASGPASLAIMGTAVASAQRAISIGEFTVGSGAYGIAIGGKANAQGTSSIAIGGSQAQDKGATAAGHFSTAIGYGAKTVNQDTTAVGKDSTANGLRATAFGVDSNAGAENALAAGPQTAASAKGAIAVGFATQATGLSSIAVGKEAIATTETSTSLGQNSQATANNAVAIGNKAVAAGTGNIVVGTNAGVYDDAVSAGRKVGADTVYIGADSGRNAYTNERQISIGKGTGNNATGVDNIALGLRSGAFVSGANNVAIGREAGMGTDAQKLSVTSTVAIGEAAKGSSNNTVAIGKTALAEKESAVAVGTLSKASGDNSVAIGKTANALGIKAVALGVDSVAVNEKDVALGSGSVTEAHHNGDYTLNSNYTAAGTSSQGTVSVGKVDAATPANSFTRQIQNVSAGVISATSTDAINGSQLYATNSYLLNLGNNVKNALGGKTAIDGEGNLTLNDLGGTGKANVHDALEAMNNKINQLGGGLGGGSSSHFYSVQTPSNDRGNYNNNGATGLDALAAGADAQAAGAFAVAVGTGAQAAISNSIAIGKNATVNEDTASDMAVNGLTKGEGSVAIGANTKASGTNATAVGQSSNAYGQNSLAAGQSSNAVGKSSVALGDGANATQDSATALGPYSQSTAAGATALGFNTHATAFGTVAAGRNSKAVANNAVAMGNEADAQKEDTIAIGYNAQATQNRAVAFGKNAKATAGDTFAFGDAAKASVGNAIAFGKNANAAHKDSIALGANSATEAAVQTTSATVGDLTFGNFAGNTPESTLSIGSAGKERTITNVAAGRISDSSTDAINGSQLYATQNVMNNIGTTAVGVLGGDAAIANDGTITMTNIGDTGKDNVHDAIKSVKETAEKGWKLKANDETESDSEKIAAGDTVTVKQGKNIRVKRSGKELTVETEDDVEFGTVSATTVLADSFISGNSVLSGEGLKIGVDGSPSQVSLTNAGLNNGGNKIANVAKGTADTDAVNVAQLNEQLAATEKTTTVVAGKNVTVSEKVDGNNTEYTVNADKTTISQAANGAVKVSEGAKDADGVTDYTLDLTDEAKADIAKGVAAKDAVDNKGLTFAADNGTTGAKKLGDSLSVKGDGNILTRADENGIGFSLADKITVGKAGNGNKPLVIDGTAGLISGLSNTTLGGADFATKGQAASEEQLNAAQANLAKLLGGNAANDKGNVTTTDIGGTGKDNVHDAIAAVKETADKGWNLNANDETSSEKIGAGDTVTFKEGKNVKVSRNGKHITVATSDDVSFDKVTVGDSVLTDNGLTVGNGKAGKPVSLTKDGLNNGGNKIANVAKGTDDTDAVNVAQLKAAAAKATSKVDSGNDNIGVTPEQNADGSTTYKVATAPNLKADSFTAGDTVVNNDGVKVGDKVALGKDGLKAGDVNITADGINAGNKAISNVAAGVKDTDAANVGQLNRLTAAAKTEVEAGTNIASVTSKKGKNGQTVYTVNADGASISAGSDNIVVTKGNKDADNVTDYAVDLSKAVKADIAKGVAAKDAVDNKGISFAGDSGTTVANKLGDTVAVKGDANITTTAGANGIQVGLNKDLKVDSVKAGDTVVNNNGVNVGDKVALGKDGLKAGDVNITADGINAGGKKVTGVAAGTVAAGSTDAVNGGQLHQVYELIGSNGGNVNTAPPSVEADGKAGLGNIKNITLVDNSNNPNVTNVTNETKIAQSNGYSLVTYNVEDQGMYVTNNVIEAVGRMNEQGIKFFHTNDGEVNPDVQARNSEDSSASGAYATAVGFQAASKGTNAIAIGKGAKANAENTIAIGTGNIVSGKNSGAIGDPTVVSGNSSYSIGNNNNVSADNAYALGSNIKATVKDSVYLGDRAQTQGIHTADAAKGEAYTYGGLNDKAVAGKAGSAAAANKVAGVVTVGNGTDETRQVQGVAAGVVSADSTDAINGSQLYYTNQAINQSVTNIGNYVVNMGNQINQRIDNVESDSKAGTAAAMAVAGLPQAYLPGKSMMAVAGGVYRGESGYAVGFSSISDGGNWVIKGTATGNSRGHYGATAGVGYQW